MEERKGVVGLALVAVLAWLWSVVLGHLDEQPALLPVITATAADGTSPELWYRWVAPERGPQPPDGWVLDPDGKPQHPVPGWRGLLLGHPLDLNTATAVDLEALPGIGPQTAAAVLADRAAVGPFPSVDSLTRVRGIGPVTVRRLHPLVTVGSPVR